MCSRQINRNNKAHEFHNSQNISIQIEEREHLIKMQQELNVVCSTLKKKVLLDMERCYYNILNLYCVIA